MIYYLSLIALIDNLFAFAGLHPTSWGHFGGGAAEAFWPLQPFLLKEAEVNLSRGTLMKRFNTGAFFRKHWTTKKAASQSGPDVESDFLKTVDL